MALLKTVELKSGAVGEYIRVAELHYHNGTSRADVRLQLWKCHDTRTKYGAEPLVEQVYTLEIDPSETGDLLQKCYESLKLLSDFEGATDI